MCMQQTESRAVARLVIAAQAGDREAFGQLFQRFKQRVLAIVLRRVGNYGDAQELCQDVFIQAMQKLGQLREPGAFGGWLGAIAQRMALNYLIRQRREMAATPESLADLIDRTDTPLSHALTRERRAQLHLVLQRLGQLDRETLVAFYLRGRSLTEMCDEFAAPLGTIKRRLHVARKRLAEQLESVGAAC